MLFKEVEMKLADCEPEVPPYSWAGRKPPSIAMARIKAKIEAQAKRAVRLAVKDRARAYAMHPRDLDALCIGFSALYPKQLVNALSEKEWVTGYRWFGFGGEVPVINLRGAMLYARWSRRVSTRRLK